MSRPNSFHAARWLLLAVCAATPAAAQSTVNAGTPVVSSHTTDEVFPSLVSDGQGGAYIGFQTAFPSGLGYAGLVHTVHLLPDATPDPAWLVGEIGSLAVLGTPTVIAAGGPGVVWAIGCAQHTPPYFMRQAGAGGVSEPPVVGGRPVPFTSELMRLVHQPDGQVMLLHTGATVDQGLMVDRVDASGTDQASTIDFPFAHTYYVPLGETFSEADGSTIVPLSAFSGTETANDLHAIKVLADGSAGWSPASRSVCMATGAQEYGASESDGAGGAFFAWTDSRSTGTGPDVYMTHLLADGTLAPGWPVNGRLLGVATGDQSDPELVADGAGGVWVVWSDSRAGAPTLYFTHMKGNGLGAVGFTAGGRPLTNAPLSRANAVVAPDRAGGVFVAWRDGRSGTGAADIYGQHILSDGSFAPGLDPDGEPICTNPVDKLDLALVDVGFAAGIVAWRDSRTGLAVVYAAPMPAGQTLDAPRPQPTRLALSPAGSNPTRDRIECLISTADAGAVTLQLLDVSGRVREARTVEGLVSGLRVRFEAPEPGLYFLSARQAGETRVTRFAVLDRR